jgi:DNA-binding response OmpR family regulator
MTQLGGLSQPVALVVRARPYARSDLVAALVEGGLFTSEVPLNAATASLVQELDPQVLVMVVDPARRADIEAVEGIAGRTQASLIGFVPRDDPAEASALLEAGVDLIIRESDGPQVVVAQVRALLRRRTRDAGRQPVETKLVVQDLVIDLDAHTVRKAGEFIPLPAFEFQVLVTLARQAGRVVGATEIARTVHGREVSPSEAQALVKTYVARLRRHLADDARQPRYIVNVRSVGYMLERRPRQSVAPEHPIRLTG